MIDGLGAALWSMACLIVSGLWVIIGLIFATFAKGRTRLAIMLSLFVVVALAYITLNTVDYYSESSVIERRSEPIVEALESYRADTGNYPDILEHLVPEYVTNLNQPATIWGWLYASSEQTFSLGYVFGVDRIGYSVCFTSSQDNEWDCLLYSPGPFEIGPTNEAPDYGYATGPTLAP